MNKNTTVPSDTGSISASPTSVPAAAANNITTTTTTTSIDDGIHPSSSNMNVAVQTNATKKKKKNKKKKSKRNVFEYDHHGDDEDDDYENDGGFRNESYSHSENDTVLPRVDGNSSGQIEQDIERSELDNINNARASILPVSEDSSSINLADTSGMRSSTRPTGRTSAAAAAATLANAAKRYSNASRPTLQKKEQHISQQHFRNLIDDDINGTFIDHRPSMTEPIIEHKKKSRERKKRKKQLKKQKKLKDQEKKQQEMLGKMIPSGNGATNNLMVSPRSSFDYGSLSNNHMNTPLSIPAPASTSRSGMKSSRQYQHGSSPGQSLSRSFQKGYSAGYPPVRSNSQQSINKNSSKPSENRSKDVFLNMSDLMKKLKRRESDTSILNSHMMYGNNNKKFNGSQMDSHSALSSNSSSFLKYNENKYNSKPPSRSDSDVSSINDVCLPLSSDEDDDMNHFYDEGEDDYDGNKSKDNKNGDSQYGGSDNGDTDDGNRNNSRRGSNGSDADDNNSDADNSQYQRNKARKQKKKKQWPDVSVLEDFSREEIERLKRQAIMVSEKLQGRYRNRDYENFPQGFYDNVEDESADYDFDNDAMSYNNASKLDTGVVNENSTGTGEDDLGSENHVTIKGTSHQQEAEHQLGFSSPIVTNVDIPELGNTKINETELLNKHKFRNKKIQPWDLTKQANLKLLSHATTPDVDPITGIIHENSAQRSPRIDPAASNGVDTNNLPGNRGHAFTKDFLTGGKSGIEYPPQIISKNPEHFRFAYFRDDIDSTVHSPTISGLLQPNQSFKDMFVGEHYRLHPHDDSDDDDDDDDGDKTGKNKDGNKKHDDVDEVASPFWLDILNPTEEEMKVLSKAFGIHPLTTEDIFLGEAREKVELFRDYYLVCFRSFDIVAEHTHASGRRSSSSNSMGGRNHDRSSSSRRSSHSHTFSVSSRSTSSGKKNRSIWKSNFLKIFKKSPSARLSKSIKRSQSIANSSSSRSRSNSQSSLLNDSSNKKYSHSTRRQARENRDLEYKKKSGDRHRPRSGELEPLNVYIIVFRTGVLTFHFAPTPHPINVRRRARLIKDYLNVTTDWIAYALIDDITDAYGPIIELIEDEVYDIEDAILKMHHGDGDSSDDDSSDDDSSDDDSSDEDEKDRRKVKTLEDEKKMLKKRNMIGYIRSRRDSNMNTNHIPISSKKNGGGHHGMHSNESGHSTVSNMSFLSSLSSQSSSSLSSASSSSSSSDTSLNDNIIGWKRKGDMLRRIAECRKKVMSVSRLLGSKADVIKSFAKRCNEEWEVAPRSDIGMYLGDIQDHIVTMVSSLNHFEKLLSRSHSNYLAQINIDMTKVNNDMNDVLGKITILGSVVLPMNVITGLWGMNCVVPGQTIENLNWFFGIVGFMALMAILAVVYTKKRFNF